MPIDGKTKKKVANRSAKIGSVNPNEKSLVKSSINPVKNPILNFVSFKTKNAQHILANYQYFYI